MSINQDEYERLKQEYKDHFREINSLKKTFNETKRKNTFISALESMNTKPLMDSVDTVISSIKEKAAIVEAKLEIALDDLTSNPEAEMMKNDFEMEREKARSTVDEIRKSLHNLEEKSTGSEAVADKKSEFNSNTVEEKEIKKTIGPKK